MAPPAAKPKKKKNQTFIKDISSFSKKYLNYKYGISLLTDPSKLPIVSAFLLIIELLLNIFVIQTVKYTEIDWKAYMQECEGFLNGTLDYSMLKGDTGPLVYPAGFVYIYSLLYYITSYGENVYLAQYIFLSIYLIQLYLVLQVYSKTKKVPPYALIITILTSYRVHSIYVLRLFNDTVAVLFFYASLNFFLREKWTLGSIFYSIAVSVKMNILLFAPALFFSYLTNLGTIHTILQLSICALIQLILGAPFLYGNFFAYINGSFDLQRIFEHKWTVNYRFLERGVFESKIFHVSLLLLHVFLLCIFLYKMRKFFTSYATLKYAESTIQSHIQKQNAEERLMRKRQKKLQKKEEENLTQEERKFLEGFESMLKKQNNDTPKAQPKPKEDDEEPSEYSLNFDRSSQLFVLPLFVVNFIGIVCARSLHYQFYVWYFHTLPYLLFTTGFKKPVIFLILALIELSWNTYPSTDLSSAMLHICHFIVLYGIYRKL